MHSHSESIYGRICYKHRLNNLIYTPLRNLQKSVCVTNFGPLGEIGANFSPQLSSQTQFATIINKKVITENQCEKHKNRV